MVPGSDDRTAGADVRVPSPGPASGRTAGADVRGPSLGLATASDRTLGRGAQYLASVAARTVVVER